MKLSSYLMVLGLAFCVSSPTFAYVDSHIQHFLDQLSASGSKPIEQMTPKDARNVLSNLQKSVKIDLSGISTHNKTIKVDGKTIPLVIVRPAGVTKQLPVFMFFHGGGWVLGDYQTHARLVHDLVVGSGAEAVFVEYTRSPEARYPVAINEAYAATEWVATHGKEINADPRHLALVGNSVGGDIVAAVSLMAKAKGTPKIQYQVLLWPVTDANFETDSYNQFADKGYFLSKKMMQWFWDNYAPDAKSRQEIYAAPLQATVEQLRGLPPALVVVNENDVLRDEGEAYAAKLDAAGVPVTSVRYNGLIHDFGLLNPISNIPAVQASLRQVANELKVHL